MSPLLLVIAFALLATPQSPATTQLRTEKQLGAALLNKVMTLRNFSKSDHQQFDEGGQPRKQGETGSWTIYSQVLVQKVEVTKSRVRIEGVRVILHYDKTQKRMLASPSDMNVTIDLDAHEGETTADASASLSQILVGSDGLVPFVPSYWRNYLGAKKETPPAPADSSRPERVRVGGNVVAANLIKKVSPVYAELAKSFLLQGLVILEVEINETGDVGNISIVQPAGAGFDENAIDAVSQWKYKPTMLEGRPVKVVTTVTVNYEFRK
jgi:TonB family protein